MSAQEVEEELQKSKLNNWTEWVLKKKIVLCTGISNPDAAFS